MGQTVATPGALALFEEAALSVHTVLARHVCGDWAQMNAEDAQSNRDALQSGARVFSSYTVHGQTVWVITEAINDATGQRDSTCVLLPEEY
ncbi:hypothetical protein E8K88_16690 [Lampropedia aestuarii]|uniref:Type I restriction endonuclease subunit M n=2 Tax=Lampropedia aestuarii TaxID=2562762 RepID=A0A4S5BJ33_9BURK|nr:hypothetical protein E8K88_16690 [Lampropedia aestuarii]